MIPVDVGSARKCSSESCGRKIFPRIDPAIIVNVSFGDYCLLGRKATWPRAMYSCLAGFAEVGETLEETVVREMFEESGVRIKPSSIRYVETQPWPFPQSLMIGFHAEAEDTNNGALPLISVDNDELEDAKWFRKEDVAKLRQKGQVATNKCIDFRIPGRFAIAWRLITRWAGRG
mmetsp:Transcript_1600/g.3668  ORF Transcript_1600/g.3668 Transcript_1600/m.3668 type:complete len:175 (-) Transcript_1600:230-754(-)